jgi:predicted secreted hydrolase
LHARGSRRRLAGAALVALGLVVVGAVVADGRALGQESAGDVMQILGAAPQGFASARVPRTFQFPEDHGAHTAFRSEWWYYTGNVATDSGRRFAFQLTFFRFALSPEPPERSSAWASNQVYMAHFAVTDIAQQRFHAAERLSREALGLAGARAAPYRVWLGNWQASTSGAFFPQRLRASDGGYAIDLRLDRRKPVVLNGDAGLSQKSPAAGNASYYYSIPRMSVSGKITTPDGDWRVQGAAWFDREWSSSALAADQEGWDWFALQLSDGRDLMVFRVRSGDGSGDGSGDAGAHGSGTLVEAGGAARSLAAQDFILDVLDYWRSPRGGTRYPSRWRLRVPSAAIDVEITPEIPDQELNLSFRYWEGASRVAGTSASVPVTGHAHVELTGYAPGGAAVPR